MRNNQRIFIVLFTFFTVVAVGSLFLLSGKGSVFIRNRDSFGAQPAVLDNSTIVAGTEATSKPVAEITPEPEASEEAEPAAEEPALSLELEPVAEEPASEEPAAEEPAQEEPVQAGEVRYYTFTVDTGSTMVLNVRTDPELSAAVVGKLRPGTKGFILKPGAQWSLVSAGGVEGYCVNSSLVVSKATVDDYPENIREKVEAPTEDIPADLFGE